MSMLLNLVGGRLVTSDLWRAALSNLKETPTCLPEHVPEIPEPVTPMERLEAGLDELGVRLIDYRDLSKWPRQKEYPWREYGWPPNKKRARPRGKRSWNDLTTVMLHSFGVHGMTYKRFLGVPCHAGVDCDGNAVLCHDLWRYIYHGDGANRFSAGIEISGDSDFDNPIQAETAYLLVRYIVEERARNADPDGPNMDEVMAVMAHRQAKKEKPVCPGREIWQAVGERVIEEGLCRVAPTMKSGLPLGNWRLRAV